MVPAASLAVLEVCARADGLLRVAGVDAAWRAAGLDPRACLGDDPSCVAALDFGQSLSEVCARAVERVEAFVD